MTIIGRELTVEALSYAVDDRDRLIRVDDGYYRFAAENGWEGAEASLGRSLWDFVAGEEVRRLQRLLLRRIREGLRSVELPFRCDSPDLRREMEIRIAAGRSGRVVLFAAKLLNEEEREAQPLLDPGRPRGGGVPLPMCAWCDRFELDGEWVEVEEAARRLQLFRRSELPPVEHTVCPRDKRVLSRA